MANSRGMGVNDMPSKWHTLSTENRRLYDLWAQTLRKCFPSKNDYDKYKYPKGMSGDWLTLSHFVRDIQAMEHYDLWVSGIERVSLVSNDGYYSKETCYFTSRRLKQEKKDAEAREVIRRLEERRKKLKESKDEDEE